MELKIILHIFGELFISNQAFTNFSRVFCVFSFLKYSDTGLDLHTEDKDGLRTEWGYHGEYSANIFADKAIEKIKNHDKDKVSF